VHDPVLPKNAERKQPEETSPAPREYKDNATRRDDASSSKQAADKVAQKAPAEKTAPTNAARTKDKADSKEKTQDSDATDAAPAAVQSGAPANEANDSTADIAEKIRAKVAQLSDILSAIASLLGVSGSVTSVQITQTTTTTISIEQQALGVNQPFVDLSDRFKQLIAAVSASQAVPSSAQTPMNMTLRSFQALFASLGNNMGAEGSALRAFDNQFMAACKSCDMQLTLATQTLSVTTSTLTASSTDSAFLSGLSDQLQKLQQWLGQFQAVTKDAAPVVAKASAVNIVQTINSDTTLAKTPAITDATTTPDNSPATPISAAATATANIAPVVQPAPVQNTAPAIAAVAVAAENTGANSGFSGGDSSGGQNSSNAQTSLSAVGSATATGNTGNTQAPSFAKTLSAAAHAPMMEQVAVNIKTAVKDGSSKIEIRLDPAELGKLSIRLSTDADGKTGVIIIADHKSTLDLLQRDSRGLEQALADAGLKADSGSLSFNLRGGNQGDQQERQSFAGYTPLLPEEDELAPLAVVSKNYVVNMSDGLDIQI
jgi:flagellar hook-length control protein FliK